MRHIHLKLRPDYASGQIVSIESKMYKLSNVIVKPLQNFKYVKPVIMEYVLNGKRKTWNMLAVHKAVCILLYNSTREVMIFVKQFRPAVYINKIPEGDRVGVIDTQKYPINLGITIELCAGIADKNVSLQQLAVEEIEEECNYKVSPNKLEKIITYRSEVTKLGSMQHLFYCEITDEMKLNSAPQEEDLEVVEMSLSEVKEFISQRDCCTTPILLFSVIWFFNNKYKK